VCVCVCVKCYRERVQCTSLKYFERPKDVLVNVDLAKMSPTVV
jgi:hypothetical protein